MTDGGEVGLAALLRLSAHTDENYVTGANSLSRIRGVRDFLFSDRALQHFVKVLFIDGNFSCLQLIDACFVNIRAHYLVSCGREARARHQPYITAPDHRQPHFAHSSTKLQALLMSLA